MSPPPFEILEHTADIGVRARGPSLAALFENAAAGLLEVAYDPQAVGARDSRPLAAEAADRESLLLNWLQEVLWLVDGEGWLPRRVEVHQISETRVTGTAHGEPRDPARHAMRVIVKAVTYHLLSIREERGTWVAEVYLDI
jgi:SHS2 domain-containing protein